MESNDIDPRKSELFHQFLQHRTKANGYFFVVFLNIGVSRRILSRLFLLTNLLDEIYMNLLENNYHNSACTPN